jgi:hypothetical protein
MSSNVCWGEVDDGTAVDDAGRDLVMCGEVLQPIGSEWVDLVVEG